MLTPAHIFEYLESRGARFYAGVPDSLLKSFCAYLSDHLPETDHLITANEGSAIAAAVGYFMATGDLPVVYMQNSGLGNAVNPLLSLADREIYSIPMIVMIGWRGEPGVRDEPQHIKQGRVLLPMLEAMEIPYRILSETPSDAERDIGWAVERAGAGSEPVALIVRAGTFSAYSPRDSAASASTLSREQAIEEIVAALDSYDVVVSTTGMISRELYEVRQRRGEDSRDFLTVGSMGHASAIASVVARKHPGRQVMCLDGDGSVLMHMGALAVQGQSGSANFKHIILNNGCHDSVGGQPTVALRVNLRAIAGACGYVVHDTVERPEQVGAAIRRLRESSGPAYLEIRVSKGARKDLGRPTSTPQETRLRFSEFLLHETSENGE